MESFDSQVVNSTKVFLILGAIAFISFVIGVGIADILLSF